jgi:histone H3/H4
MANESTSEHKKEGNGVEEIDKEVEARLPFPSAPVVRVMREAIDRDKIISKRVKIEMNKWLADICKNVSKELNKTPYAKIEGDDFFNAIKRYKQFENMHREKERIKTALERIIQDAQMLISELERAVK